MVVDRDAERAIFNELDVRGARILALLRAGRIDTTEALRAVDELYAWALRARSLVPERQTRQ